MALVEGLVDPTDVNLTLDNEFGNRMRWQMDAGEWEARLDEAAYAVTAILNRPFYESDLTPQERLEAERAYAAQPYALQEV